MAVPCFYSCLLAFVQLLDSPQTFCAACHLCPVQLVALVALAAVVMGIEGRVVFHAFQQYIILHPPWSYIIITAAMYGAAAMVVLHVTGLAPCSLDIGQGMGSLMVMYHK